MNRTSVTRINNHETNNEASKWFARFISECRFRSLIIGEFLHPGFTSYEFSSVCSFQINWNTTICAANLTKLVIIAVSHCMKLHMINEACLRQTNADIFLNGLFLSGYLLVDCSWDCGLLKHLQPFLDARFPLYAVETVHFTISINHHVYLNQVLQKVSKTFSWFVLRTYFLTKFIIQDLFVSPISMTWSIHWSLWWWMHDSRLTELALERNLESGVWDKALIPRIL